MIMCAPGRYSTWDARGRLPLGADITACLQAIRDRDGLTTPATSTAAAMGGAHEQPTAHAMQQAEPHGLLRLLYAMALIRLVNGISDSSQKGRVAVSVAQLAEDAGVLPAPPPPHATVHPCLTTHQQCTVQHSTLMTIVAPAWKRHNGRIIVSLFGCSTTDPMDV